MSSEFQHNAIKIMPPKRLSETFGIHLQATGMIEQKIQANAKCFVHGPSGIGKSVLIEQWFLQSFTQKKFLHFIWIPCQKGILAGLFQMGLFDKALLDIKPEKRHLKPVVQALSQLKHCLIALDGLQQDCKTELDFFSKLPLKKTHSALICTLTTQETPVNTGADSSILFTPNIALAELSLADSRKIFLQFKRIGKNQTQEQWFQQICNLSEKRTLVIILIAKLAQHQQLSLETLYDILNSSLKNISKQSQPTVRIGNIIRKLFEFIPRQNAKALLQLAFFDQQPFQSSTAHDWYQILPETLSELVDIGWLQSLKINDEQWFKLDPLIVSALDSIKKNKQNTYQDLDMYYFKHILRALQQEAEHISKNSAIKHYHLLTYAVSFIDKTLCHNPFDCAPLPEEQLVGSSTLDQPLAHLFCQSYSWLGYLYFNYGNLKQAERFYKKSIACHQRLFGLTHPNFSSLLMNLANLYLKLNRYQQAAPLLEQALELRLNNLGEDHLKTANSYHHLGLLHLKQHNYSKAESCLKKGLDIKLSQTDEKQPSVTSHLMHLGRLFHLTKQEEKAIPLYQQALLVNSKQPHNNPIESATLQNNLATLHLKKGDYLRAESLLLQALKTYQQHFEANRPEIAHILNNLGELHLKKGQWKQAESYLQKALNLRTEALGNHAPLTAVSLNNLGCLYFELNQFSVALNYFSKTFKIREKSSPDDSLEIANCHNNLGETYLHLNELPKAEQCFKKALSIQQAHFGGFHSDIATTLNNQANLFLKKGQLQQALKHLLEALKINEKTHGKHHLNTATTMNNLAGIYLRQKDYDQANQLYNQSITVFNEVLGQSHPNTMIIKENINTLESLPPEL